MNISTVINKIPDALQKPPIHCWDGPQPGLCAQADETRRFHYSATSGALESVVQYTPAGAPDFRISYRRGVPYEISIWNGNRYVSYGLVEQDGTIKRTHSLPRLMIDAQGEECEIPKDDASIFITPAGFVVRLVDGGLFFKKTRAEFQGRVKDFSPLEPFVMQRGDTFQEISIDKKNILIDVSGVVFENGENGLQAIGELVPREKVSRRSIESIQIPHEMFVLSLKPDEDDPYKAVHMQHIDPEIQEFLSGPLHKVVGKHPFLHNSVPELTDMYGSKAAEEQLRIVERLATEVGLTRFAAAHAKEQGHKAAFLRAQQQLESALWQQVVELERLVDMEHHTLINPAYIRAWIDEAAEHPHDALISLRRTAVRHS